MVDLKTTELERSCGGARFLTRTGCRSHFQTLQPWCLSARGDRGDNQRHDQVMCWSFVVGQHAGNLRTPSHPYSMATSYCFCYEGDCAHEQSPRSFPSEQSLRQHQNRRHKGTKGEETSMGRALKRKRDADAAEEQQTRQQLEEARVAAEAARHTPEPPPVWPSA